MSFLGLSVRVKNGVPNLHAVLLDEQGLLVDQFFLDSAASSGPADQILEIASTLAGRLAILEPTPSKIVLRLGSEKAGHGKVERQHRTRTEGAVTYVARQICPAVETLYAQSIGPACGLEKNAVEAAAKAILPERWEHAVSAALAARGDQAA